MLMLQLLYSTAWCLVLLCLFCDISSGSDKERRDVHRIIIKEKVNRSRANNHHHNREHPRSHQYESYEKNREHENHPNPTRKPKKRAQKPSASQEDRLTAYSSDWRPVISKSNEFMDSPQSSEHHDRRTKTAPSLQPSRLHELVDMTTSFPSKKAIPSVYKSNLNRVNHMNYFNYKIKQNIPDSNTAEESRQKLNVDRGSIKRPVKKQIETKHIDGGYQVHENLEEDVRTPKPTSFNALSPSVAKSVPLYPPLPVFEDNHIRDQFNDASQEVIQDFSEQTYGKRIKKPANN